METTPLTCFANHCTCFYMTAIAVMKELIGHLRRLLRKYYTWNLT